MTPNTTDKEEEFREMRIRKVPYDLHRKIVAHQKLMSLELKKDLSLDEACIDLWNRAADMLPKLNP